MSRTIQEIALNPIVQVGIMSHQNIHASLLTPYMMEGKTKEGYRKEQQLNGDVWFHYQEGNIRVEGDDTIYSEILLQPCDEENGLFDLHDVTIGIHFHWERKEIQRFPHALKIIVVDNQLTAVNILPVEDYLKSVISSEMSATASLELLKAHAVISRSWLLSQIIKEDKNKETSHQATAGNEEELIRWYDRDDHFFFDVCADDHCQRYQGVTKSSTPMVSQAIEATRGEVLCYDRQICDARFSKSCGGAFEEFSYCWEDVHVPYLVKKRDSLTDTFLPDLRKEKEAVKWITSTPEAFCNTHDKHILSQVLNNYDQETTDFYRWKVVYTQTELSELIHKKSGIDFGDIMELMPLERGTSGRISRLKIVGSKKTMVIGKELEIRRILSPSHLYSSAFVVEKEMEGNQQIPVKFHLKGAGWGHGVGLCQIGAAVMGEKGYSYREILQHYFDGAELKKIDELAAE